MLQIIIAMAGQGERFKVAGHVCEKYEIETHGRTLFEWSVLSLEQFFADAHFIFVARKDQNAAPMIRKQCAALGIRAHSVVELDAPTDGQATTVRMAQEALPSYESPILIYNIDTYVESSALSPRDIRGDGWVPAFLSEGDRWSFVEIDQDLHITNIAEKKRISPLASIGLYYFSSFALFDQCYQTANATGLRERFVAPLYSAILNNEDYPVYSHLVPAEKVHVLGTPEDLRQFHPRQSFLAAHTVG